MEKINLGNYNICTSWNEVTLLQWQNYVKKASENNGAVDIISTLETFSDIPREVINQMPTDLFESVIKRLKWVSSEPEIEPSNKVVIDGEEYLINHMEKLKVKEYLDINTVLENDKYNYSVLFAILCRKPNEEYDEAFIADVLPHRIEMFEKSNVLQTMGLITFFLTLSIGLRKHSQSYLVAEHLREELTEVVKSIKSSLKLTDYITPSKVQQIMTLRKLEKSLKNI